MLEGGNQGYRPSVNKQLNFNLNRGWLFLTIVVISLVCYCIGEWGGSERQEHTESYYTDSLDLQMHRQIDGSEAHIGFSSNPVG